MYAPLSADIITAERWSMIMPMAVLSNFLIYCVVNAFTPGPGNILALNTVTNYGYKKGKPLFFGIFAGYYVVQILCAIFVYGVNSLLPNVMEVMKYIGAAYILWLAIHIAFSTPKPIQVQVAIVPIVAITSSKNSKAGKEDIYPKT